MTSVLDFQVFWTFLLKIQFLSKKFVDKKIGFSCNEKLFLGGGGSDFTELGGGGNLAIRQ